jgi:putative DNA primase/helicase
MFAGIGELPTTLQDRSIIMRLRRAKPGEVTRHIKNGTCDDLHDCGRKLARWAQDLQVWPDISLPKNLSNRIGDNWLPLITIAQIAGGDWPARVDLAVEEALGVHEGGQLHDLLADIHEVYGEQEKMWTSAIVDKLVALDDKPYGECHFGKEITQNWLAKQLKGVTSKFSQDIRVGSEVKKGYSRETFFDAWERYGIGVESALSVSNPDKKWPESATKGPQTATISEAATSNSLISKGCSVVAAVAPISTPLRESAPQSDAEDTEEW